MDVQILDCHQKIFIEGKRYVKRTADGNLVNFGNSDADGANVNRWNPDNSNSNIGVCAS